MGKLAYDAVIVDEGQDFSDAWIAALRVAIESEGPFYVFADSHQQLYRRFWRAPADWTVLELELNCRNTLPICQRVSTVFGESPSSLGDARTGSAVLCR